MPRSSPNPTDIYVGGRVRQLRDKLGVTQQKLAGQLGLTFQQVQKYEKGTNRISASRLQHIAQILDVDVPYFFDSAPRATSSARRTNGADRSTDARDLTGFARSAEGLALIKAFRKIEDVTTRRALARMVQAIAATDETAN